MPEPILFYFDFLSPYGYLGSVELERLAQRRGVEVEWRPVLLGITVLKVMGLKALPDTPLKGDYVRRDVPRLAKYLRIPFRRPPSGPSTSLPAMRAFTWVKRRDPELASRFGRAIYRRQWSEGVDVSTSEAVAAVAEPLGIDASDLLRAVQDDEVKQRLQTEVSRAIDAGVFGVPTFVVGGEMFWGADRLPMVERWLDTGGW